MKKLVFSMLSLLLCYGVYGQELEKQRIPEFDQERSGIPRGKIDTILDTFAWVGGFSSAPNTKEPETLIPDPQAAKDYRKFCGFPVGMKTGFSASVNAPIITWTNMIYPISTTSNQVAMILKCGKVVCTCFPNCCLSL